MIWWALPVYTCLTDIQCNAPIKQGAKKPNIQAGPSGKLYVTAMSELNIILSSPTKIHFSFYFCYMYLNFLKKRVSLKTLLDLHSWSNSLTEKSTICRPRLSDCTYVQPRIKCKYVFFYQWGHFVMLIIRKLKLIRNQSWTYLSDWEGTFLPHFCLQCKEFS